MIFLLSLLMIFKLGSTAAYSVPYCLTSGVTWNSPVFSGVQHVGSPDECQLLCADSGDCDSVTWYDSQASPHSNYCEMFLSPDTSNQVPCSNCVSGPETCICSGLYICSMDSDHLIELLFAIESEFICAELCFNSSVCKYYSWYTPENYGLKDTCALLSGCSERIASDTCHSGPSDCTDLDILTQDYPLCYKSGATWSEDTSKGVTNITSPYTCQDLCNNDEECSSFTWFSSIAKPFKNFCEFFPEEVSEPDVQCSDCVSGLSSCTCSGSEYQTCDTSQEIVIEILQHIESELKCQDLCARHKDCSWYTWYSEEGDRFQFTCVLLESCTKKTQCQGCASGPDNCENINLLSLPLLQPQCTYYKDLTSYTRNVITVDTGKLCNGGTCCDKSTSSHSPPDWAGEGWYRFNHAAGKKILETPPGRDFCGTDFAGYMVGGHPTVEEGEATRTLYFDNGGSHQDSPTNIRVVNCHNFFLYYLVDVPGCSRGYCGE